MDELRFQRPEDKVDHVKEDLQELRTDIKIHMSKVEDHVAGDNKIITHIMPLLEKLPEIVTMLEDHDFQKRKKEDIKKTISTIAKVAASITAVVTALMTVRELL